MRSKKLRKFHCYLHYPTTHQAQADTFAALHNPLFSKTEMTRGGTWATHLTAPPTSLWPRGYTNIFLNNSRRFAFVEFLQKKFGLLRLNSLRLRRSPETANRKSYTVFSNGATIGGVIPYHTRILRVKSSSIWLFCDGRQVVICSEFASVHRPHLLNIARSPHFEWASCFMTVSFFITMFTSKRLYLVVSH
jgi:hypothetical protein